MRTTTTVIVGAGHAGLAMSRCLTDRSIDHVLLERGAVAHSWSTGRWDSLRLLTPNWQSRLPGHRYTGDDPDGFMTMPEVISFLRSVRHRDRRARGDQHGGHVGAGRRRRLQRDHHRGSVARPQHVVLANGACGVPKSPPSAADLPTGVRSMAAADYRNPDDLEHGGVLVAGASATGIQLADEIHRSGRPVTIAVGGHVRVPRTYRGMDIMWWLDAAGVLDERHDEVDDVTRVRSLPSFQLVGTPERATIDLNALQAIGVRIVGRLAARPRRHRAALRVAAQPVQPRRPQAEPPLGRHRRVGDGRRARRGGRRAPPARADGGRGRPARSRSPCRTATIKTVIWATGFRPDFSWLDVPGARPQGPGPARRRSHAGRRAST